MRVCDASFLSACNPSNAFTYACEGRAFRALQISISYLFHWHFRPMYLLFLN